MSNAVLRMDHRFFVGLDCDPSKEIAGSFSSPFYLLQHSALDYEEHDALCKVYQGRFIWEDVVHTKDQKK